MAVVIEIAEMVRIPLAVLKKDSYPTNVAKISKSLTFKLPDGGSFGGSDKEPEERVIRLYRITDDTLEVPRYYPWQEHVKGNYVTRISASEGEVVDWTFKGKLIQTAGKDQVAAVKKLSTTRGGILAAATGKGKTVIAIAAASTVKRRALVIVPTDFLLKQWVSSLVKFTNLAPQEIGIVRGETAQWDRPFIVGMVQTLSQRDFRKEYTDSVGLLICDEVHRMGAPEWIKTISKFSAARRWGLSATVNRPDGMDAAFTLHIGRVVHEMLSIDVIPTTCVLRMATEIPPRRYTNVWNGELNFAKLHTLITKDAKRNSILAAEIKKAYDAGRKIIALSKRLEHLDEMAKLCVALGIPQSAVGVLNSKTKEKVREQILKDRRVIFGIEQIAGLGLDQPDLDTLFWLSPMQSVKQNVGRILRVFEDKRTPLVVDPWDENIDVFRGMGFARQKVYQAEGYDVRILDKRGA